MFCLIAKLAFKLLNWQRYKGLGHIYVKATEELKIGEFQPEFAGKMDFYLNVLNDKERAPDDNPSIGIILCAEKNAVEVEYALRSKGNPIGVADYQLQSRLPSELKGKLPSAAALKNALKHDLR